MKNLIFKLFKRFITLNKILTILVSHSANSNFLKYTSLLDKNSGKGLIEGKVNTNNPDNKKSLFNSVKDDKFNEWLAGIIDGDGCFLLSKKGYASLEIVTQLRGGVNVVYILLNKNMEDQ